MAPKNRVIIDTDPGCDDVLALLLALSASSEELEVVLISVTHGNVDVRTCLKNALATFHVLDKEVAWRKEHNLPVGFDGIIKFRPIIAVGADEPLHDKFESADYFHGLDGLAGSHTTHPHFTPEEVFLSVFEETLSGSKGDDYISRSAGSDAELQQPTTSYTPSRLPAHKEILRVLRDNDADTITLVSLGPLTNFALAAAEDPETFLRAKELVAMGGAVDCFGNVTPVAEFNVFADAVAAARVFALTSQVPGSTMPAIPSVTSTGLTLPSYPDDPTSTIFSKQLRLILMSLDITEYHALTRRDFNTYAKPLAQKGSPLAQFLDAFMTPMLDKMESLHLGHEGDGAALSLHDPLTIWYVLTQDREGWKPSEKSPEDIRVETLGQWTRGMTVGDRRLRRRRNSDGVRPHDRGNWLGNRSGNRVWRMLESPGRDLAGIDLMDRVLGVRTE